MPRSGQMELELLYPAGGFCFTATRTLLKHRYHKTVLKKIYYVLRFFPELQGRTLRVGLTQAASGMAEPGGDKFWLNPAQSSYHTIAHEFIHLIQGTGGIPRSERSCDLFALARHWTLNDVAPHYLAIPKSFMDENGRIPPNAAKKLYRAAVESLRLRDMEINNYIKHFEDGLRSATAVFAV